MSDSNDTSLKRCSKCGVEYPATREYFHVASKAKDKLNTQCKVCRSKISRKRYEQNTERILSVNRQWRDANPEKQQQARDRWNVENPEYFQNYYISNKDRKSEQNRNWRLTNIERVTAYQRRWAMDNRQIRRLHEHRRDTRRMSLPDTFTFQHWQYCLQYFDNRCAYCREKVERLDMEHFIPLSHPQCPGTTPENMLPACPACNYSKHTTLPLEWINRRFPDTAAEIIARIETYFEHIRK